MKYLIKLDRLSAWILLIGMTLYFISGYGITKGIIDPSFAYKIHVDWLSIVIIIAFVLHAGFATRLALIRWKFWNIAGKSLWFIFFLSFLASFIYLDKIYKKPIPSSLNSINMTTPNTTNANSSSPINNRDDDDDDEDSTPVTIAKSTPNTTPATSITPFTANPSTASAKVFNKNELAKYTGTNGNRPYVAVDGVVYDMSAIFRSGSHFSHFAGQELTSAFYSQHAKSSITKYPVVGTYKP